MHVCVCVGRGGGEVECMFDNYVCQLVLLVGTLKPDCDCVCCIHYTCITVLRSLGGGGVSAVKPFSAPCPKPLTHVW